MHALRHVHGLVVPGGKLIDMHPVSEDHVEAGNGRVGVIREPEWLNVELPNSEASLRQTVAEGLFELEVETEYDVLEHFDRAEELVGTKRDVIEGQHELIAAIHAAPPPLRTRTRVVFRRLRVRRP